MTIAPRPLEGSRVLEVGGILPVPATGASLARLGAEVTRVVSPKGDAARELYGGWLHELYGSAKRVVTIDLPGGELDELLGASDVVVVGFRPRAAASLRVDAATVLAAHPRVVHCSIVGYPAASEDADRPGHDLSFLARSGMLLEPAGPSAIGLPPVRPAIPVADLAAAAVATQAILAGLLGRARHGGGCHVEVPISDVTLAWAAPRMGRAVSPAYGAALDPANDVYRCADGRFVAVAAIEPRFWAALHVELGGLVELPDGSASWSSADRIARMDELAALLREAFTAHDSTTWIERLDRCDVPVDLVLDAAEVVEQVGTDLAAWRQLATAVPVPVPHAPTGVAP